MKNKKVTYLLLAAVAAIWGTVIYRIIAGSGGGELEVYQDVPFLSPILMDETVPDSFELSGSYRDPFLGKMGRYSSGGFSDASAKPKVKKTPKKPVPKPVLKSWHFVHFDGNLLEGAAHLMVNGQPCWVNPGETCHNVTLKSIFGSDSIEVVHEGIPGIIKKTPQ